MAGAPTNEQINAALKRARDAAKARTPYPERLLMRPLYNRKPERVDERWWLIGQISVLGQAEQWDVLYDPETDEGRLSALRSSG